MKSLLAFILGFLAGLSREVWWPYATRAVEWVVEQLGKSQ